MIAAHKTGRRAHLAELDPIYVDRMVRRWQAFANDDAILVETGETFEQTARAYQEGLRAGATEAPEILQTEILEAAAKPGVQSNIGEAL